MGRRKGQHGKPQYASKRPKLRKYWVEDFPELDVEKSDIALYITRVTLSDAHHEKLQVNIDEKASTEVVDSSIEQETLVTAQVTSTTSLAFDATILQSDEQQCDPIPDSRPKESADRAIVHLQCHSDDSKITEEKDCDRMLSISVKRASYAPLSFYRDPNFRVKKNGDCGDGIVNPYPKNEVPDKYWAQRKRLFTRFSDGIQLDKESWYSLWNYCQPKMIQ